MTYSEGKSVGATYVRWGRKVCEGRATVVYKGTYRLVLFHFMWHPKAGLEYRQNAIQSQKNKSKV